MEDEWVPARAIEELTLKRALQDIEDPVKLATEILKESLPLVTMAMTHAAIYEPNPMIRFNSQKYVMDRMLGSVTSPVKPESEAPAWQKIFDSIAVVADTKAE